MPLPSGYVRSLLPQIATQIQFGVGAQPVTADYKPVVLGNKLAASPAAVAVPIEVTGPDDANTQFGARSELAAMCRSFFKVAPRGRLWACPVAENGSAVAATATLLFATTAAAGGVVRVKIGDRTLPDVVVSTGDTASTIATAVNAMIAAYDEELPCTSGVSTATVTLTAAQGGTRGNNLRVAAEIIPSGATAVSTTVALNGGSGASKVDGRFGTDSATAGSGDDDFTSALAAVYSGSYDVIVAACADDTNRGRVSTHVTSASAISEGRRRVAVMGSIEGTLSTATADAVALNNPRVIHPHLKGAYNTTGEIAAAFTAARIYGDGTINGIAQYTAANQNGLQLAPAILAPEVADYTTNNQKATLLAGGVTPLAASSARPGYAQVVRPVTTRTLALSGATSYAVIDPSKVTVADEVARRWEAFCSAAYAGKNLAPDPASPELQSSSPLVVYPSGIREDILALLRTMEEEGKLVDVNGHASEVDVTIDSVDNTIATCTIPVDVIPHLHSVINQINQVG